MATLNTALMTAMQSLFAQQAALVATSNNIANANTPGYTREVPQFSEAQPVQSGSQSVGAGVVLSGLQSVRDELLNLQIQQQTSLQSNADTQSASLQLVQTNFTPSGGDIASELTAFSSSLSKLSANPTSSAARQGVLSSGQDLANAFHSTVNGLTSAQTGADGQVTQSVAQINTLSKQIAQLNAQLGQITATGQEGGTVQDKRDQLVQQLSTVTGLSISQSSDGETITTGNGTPLVVGGRSFTLQTTTGSDGMKHVLDSNGEDITKSLEGGQLGGAIQVRDQVIPGLITQLNTLASEFAQQFNSAQAQGRDQNGITGQDFFSLSLNANGAAASINVAITSASLIAASSDGSSGSNGNVANLVDVLNARLPSGLTPADSYASLVFQVGSAVSNANTQSTSIGLNLQQLTNQQGSVSGVNIDEESTNLIRYQTAYEAAARVVSTIQQLNSIILNMGTNGGY